MKITKVTMYKSTDGQLHETESACKTHEARTSIQPLVMALLEKTNDPAIMQTDAPTFTPNALCAWVSQNADSLLDILLPLQAKKPSVPRKAKESVAPTAPATNATDPAPSTTPNETGAETAVA